MLSTRALNRATLARQLLIERVDRPILDTVTHLVGLQAQEPPNPYLALWSRLAGFQPKDLSQLLVDRKVVRTVVMRSTIHLVTADDCLRLRPLMQPVLDGEIARHRDSDRTYAMSTLVRSSISPAESSLTPRLPVSFVPHWSSGSPSTTPPPSPTPAAVTWPSSKYRREGSGGGADRCGSRPPRRGSARRCRRMGPSTMSCCAISLRSDRRQPATSRRGRASPASGR